MRIMALAGLVVAAACGTAMGGFVDDMATNPVGTRATVEGDNVSRDTAGNPTVPFDWSAGKVVQHLNTNWDWLTYGFGDRGVGQGSRLTWGLGKTYTKSDSFSFGARLNIRSAGLSLAADQMMPIAFGLVNTATTGMDRSGAWTGNRDAFDSLEWNFFPNPSTYGWPTLQQTVLGSQVGDGDSMFWNFAANFGTVTLLSDDKTNPASPLYGNTYGLPLDTRMDVTMTYDGATHTVRMLVRNASNGQVLVDSATLADLNLDAPIGGFGSASAFSVNALSIMNYQDGWAFGDVTAVATVEYERVWFQEAGADVVVEPGTLMVIGLLTLVRRRRN